jgi:hypothetical protein
MEQSKAQIKNLMQGDKMKKKLIDVVDFDRTDKLNLPPLDKIKNKDKNGLVMNSPAVKEKKPKMDAVTKVDKMFDLGGVFSQPEVFGNFKKGHSGPPGHKDKANK